MNAAARDATGSASVVISAGGRSLKRIVVSPQDAHIGPAGRTFVAVGLDADGLEMPLAGVDWRATGGTIDVNGIFQAGMEEGFFTITASAEGVSSFVESHRQGLKSSLGASYLIKMDPIL